MHISRKTWYLYLSLALLSLACWFQFSYHRFSFIDLSVDKNAALQAAQGYLQKEAKVNPSEYHHAIVFSGSRNADRYLQKTMGFKKALAFLKEHDLDLFSWAIRFFKENEKQEFFVRVSAASGKVIGFRHTTGHRTDIPQQNEQEAKDKAIAFLKRQVNFEPEDFSLKSNLTTVGKKHNDYLFKWEKKNVDIRWSQEKGSGRATIILSVKISGDDIILFSKPHLKIPSEFNRYLDRKRNVGANITVLLRIIFFIILTLSIFHVIVRRNNLVMHTVKNFCIALTAALFVLKLLFYANHYQNVLYNYPTTSSMTSYFFQYCMGLFMDLFVVTITILMPILAGESLHYEIFPQKPRGSFLHYLISSFWTKDVFTRISFGYVVAVILIGIQSVLFQFGQKYCGVWAEYSMMSQLSASILPFFSALVIGLNASISEEITFRLFSISIGKKFLKNTALAAILASVIWGFGHSSYPVFPMWFRGIEVSVLGFFLSLVYLRYGIIPVLVAHYLFDVFWGNSPFLLGQATPFLKIGAWGTLLLPLGLGVIAFFKNDPEKERSMTWKLTKHQLYNKNILSHYLRTHQMIDGKTDEDIDTLKKQIVSHGWDIAVVELTIDEIRGGL